MYSQERRLDRNWEAAIAKAPRYLDAKSEKGMAWRECQTARRTLYTRRLKGKQKLARCYSLRDARLRRYAQRARTAKSRSPRALVQILESRLDNVIRRLRWARSIRQARQMVWHGHFLVNGRKVDLPSFRVRAGDTITVDEDSRMFVQQSAGNGKSNALGIPGWLSVNGDRLSACVSHLPEFDEVPTPLETDYKSTMKFYARWLSA